VAVQGQHPRLGQQRPHEAEQQQQGEAGAKQGPQHNSAK
jgi:hypothetical protein